MCGKIEFSAALGQKRFSLPKQLHLPSVRSEHPTPPPRWEGQNLNGRQGIRKKGKSQFLQGQASGYKRRRQFPGDDNLPALGRFKMGGCQFQRGVVLNGGPHQNRKKNGPKNVPKTSQGQGSSALSAARAWLVCALRVAQPAPAAVGHPAGGSVEETEGWATSFAFSLAIQAQNCSCQQGGGDSIWALKTHDAKTHTKKNIKKAKRKQM